MAFGDDRIAKKLQRGVWPILCYIGMILAVLTFAGFKIAYARFDDAAGLALVALFPTVLLWSKFKSYRTGEPQN